jgi:hypothetical protein
MSGPLPSTPFSDSLFTSHLIAQWYVISGIESIVKYTMNKQKNIGTHYNASSGFILQGRLVVGT